MPTNLHVCTGVFGFQTTPWVTAAQKRPLNHASQAPFDFRPDPYPPAPLALRVSSRRFSRLLLLLLLALATPVSWQKLKNHAHSAGDRGDNGAVGFKHELSDGLAVVVGVYAVGAGGGGGDDGVVKPAREEVAQGYRRFAGSGAGAGAAGRC